MKESLSSNYDGQENFNQEAGPEKNKDFFQELTSLVGDLYAERIANKDNDNLNQLLIKDNMDHIKQVEDNVSFIIGEIKAGRMTDATMAKDKNGEVIFDEKLLKTMAALHDVAKIDEAGKLDTFYHHDREKVAKILSNKSSPIQQFLVKNNFSQEEIDLIIDGIERHSRRTDFIYREFYNQNKDEARFLPAPEGVLEYVILSDADILTQSRLDQGVKKIVSSRLTNDFFRQDDATGGRHSFAKTLASAVDSARKAGEVMHFAATKEKNASQLKQVLEFVGWLESNNKILEIDDLNDFVAKKKRFDKLIVEFLQTELEK